ncbi:ATP-binding cassette domain-containing protein [Verminephrobacter eiseniae]|uniref:ABC transporter ATP-binding protein n=1 Tax=Verminephrobacter eiseniae TaxID=364317 RepID=UPI002238F897|nr:oligopeptide/dipeptide ABC transporter ATP-binding protein [Verminephrobacter eiseniae]MCW5259301.1 ATP-binding cassette domain-containing protein [Verminephrobacter eiseniae]
MAGNGTAALRAADLALLRVENLVRVYRAKGGQRVQAVSDVSFDLLPGETLGVVGESGCGKSTLAKALMMLAPPTAGTIWFERSPLTGRSEAVLRAMRPRLQMVFQDPVSSLNPRQTMQKIVETPLEVHGLGTAAERRERAHQMLAAVGLDVDQVGQRRPHELSGGQCQRVSIARALVLQPSLLVCDEPVSALDVSVQAQVVNLLEQAKKDFALTMVFISHDLLVVKSISDRVMVMYLGKVCEIGAADEVYSRPAHPYTRMLLDAIPDPQRPRALATPDNGETPSPMNMPGACRFHTRCVQATALCAREEPVLQACGDDHFVACHHPQSDWISGSGE